MAIARRFLIASSLTRLIRKERGSERIVEGHFAGAVERRSHIRVEKGQSFLVLSGAVGDAAASEDWTEIPRSHAEALLDACTGTVVFERSRIRLRSHEALVDRFVNPSSLDLVSVEFSSRSDADGFVPPPWFGAEVTDDAAYENRAIAVERRPHVPEVPLSNAALDAILDLIESRSSEVHMPQVERHEDGALERLRRLAASRPAAPATAPVAAPVVPPARPAAGDGDEPKPGEGIAQLQFRRRRPQVQSRAVEDDGDERLAGVIQGLSEALSQTPTEKR
jgi:CYTH domain-containing protein